jgi:hypothetical protein
MNRPKWLVSACLYECGKVALTVLHGSKLDPAASLTAEDDREVVAYGFIAGGVHLVTVPIDYSENTRVFVEELGGRADDIGLA